jgi:hypothetical protein
LAYFSRFGILYQEKSGNPGRDVFFSDFTIGKRSAGPNLLKKNLREKNIFPSVE